MKLKAEKKALLKLIALKQPDLINKSPQVFKDRYDFGRSRFYTEQLVSGNRNIDESNIISFLFA